jgi:hypothetical protein
MTAPEKPDYVLFLTPSCKFCNNFLSKLKEKPELLKKFNVVNIDKLQVIPDEVDEVPCVYDGKNVSMGANAFKWLNEKLIEFLSPANDGLQYSFVDGQDEQVFNNYSLLDQRNGSFGMGDSPSEQKDPTRMAVQNDNTNKNRTMDSLMASRSELK